MARSAVLVVRVWKEGDGERIVARITSRADAEQEDTEIAVVGTFEEILAAAERWMEAFLAG